MAVFGLDIQHGKLNVGSVDLQLKELSLSVRPDVQREVVARTPVGLANLDTGAELLKLSLDCRERIVLAHAFLL